MALPEFDLSGKVAFVTGAGRGIGKGIAEALAEAGADVVINSLTDKYVTGLAADLAKATGRRVVPLVADVTKSDEVVRDEGHHAAARRLGEVGGEAGHVLVGQAVDDDVRAGLRERLGYALADAPARARHERDLAAQVELGKGHRLRTDALDELLRRPLAPLRSKPFLGRQQVRSVLHVQAVGVRPVLVHAAPRVR